VSYLTNWAHEEAGRPVNWEGSLNTIRMLEQAGRTQPIALPSAEFRDPATYSAMTYTKPSLVFRMLHWLVGDEAFRQALQTYYEANRLQHVTETDLRAAFNAASPGNLDWFFDQWIHTTGTLDYRIGRAATRQADDGTWITEVEVIREGEIWMPVDIRVGESVYRLTARDRRQGVTITTSERPASVTIDPENVLLDLDPANNVRPLPR
jgi:hypothetical protein